jgi:hypothetical protein
LQEVGRVDEIGEIGRKTEVGGVGVGPVVKGR